LIAMEGFGELCGSLISWLRDLGLLG